MKMKGLFALMLAAAAGLALFTACGGSGDGGGDGDGSASGQTYTISAPESEDYRVTAPASAKEGDSVSVTVTVRDDGSTQVKAYRLGAKGPRYEELFATEHCRVLRTPAGKIIEKWSFRPSLTADGIRILRNLESPRIDAFYISRKLGTKW